jgi:hypothetical protein
MRIDRDQPAVLRGFNSLLLPLKLMIPQPIIKKIPGLTTNEDVRLRLVLSQVSGKLRLNMGKRALIRSKSFRWSRSASKTWEALLELALENK